MCYTWLFFSPQECNCGPSVPPDIRKAVREHLKKRRKLQQQSIFGQSQHLNIQQHRELVKRESSGFSVWKLVLPRCHDIVSDPIVEYRNSHRIIFIKQMPEVSKYAARYISRAHVMQRKNNSLHHVRTYLYYRTQQFTRLERV
jgi:hypothetical protein